MSKTTAIHTGDVVRFRYGTAMITGTVKEDRGPIGVKGRNLYLVEFAPEPQSPSQIELPAELLERCSTWAILGLGPRGPAIEQASNLSGVTDHGGPGFDLTLTFSEPLPNDLYACQVSANREVAYRVKSKTRECVRLVIQEPLPERVKVVCIP